MRSLPRLAAALVTLAAAGGAAATTAPPKEPLAPARLQVTARAPVGAPLVPGVPVSVRVTVRNAGIEDLTEVRVVDLRAPGMGVMSKERGAQPADAPGSLGDLPVGASRTFRLTLMPERAGRACAVVRVRSVEAATAAASACVGDRPAVR